MKYCCVTPIITLLLNCTVLPTLPAMQVNHSPPQPDIELTTFHKNRITTLAESRAKAERLQKLLYDLLAPMPQELLDIILLYDHYPMQCVHSLQKIHGSSIDSPLTIQSIKPLSGNLIAIGFFNGPLYIQDIAAQSKQQYGYEVKAPDDDEWNSCWRIAQLPNGQIATATGNICTAIDVANFSESKAAEISHFTCIGECWDGRQLVSITALIMIDDQRFVVGSKDGLIQIRSKQGFEYDGISGLRSIWHPGLTPFSRKGTCKKTLKEHHSPIYALLYFPNLNILVSGSADGIIKLWNLAQNDSAHTITEHKGAITSLAKRSEHEFASGAASDGSIHIWDLETGNCVHTLQTEGSGVFCLNLLIDNRLVCLLKEGTVQIWDLNRMQCTQIAEPDLQSPIVDLQGAYDGQKVITAHKDNAIRVWQ